MNKRVRKADRFTQWGTPSATGRSLTLALHRSRLTSKVPTAEPSSLLQSHRLPWSWACHRGQSLPKTYLAYVGICLPAVISCSYGSTHHRVSSLLWCNSPLLTRKMRGSKRCLTAQLLLLKSNHSRNREMKEYTPNLKAMFTNHFGSS